MTCFILFCFRYRIKNIENIEKTVSGIGTDKNFWKNTVFLFYYLYPFIPGQ